jgi:hypothetical protein
MIPLLNGDTSRGMDQANAPYRRARRGDRCGVVKSAAARQAKT